MRRQFRSAPHWIVTVVVGVVALSVPVEVLAGCSVSVEFYNDQRRFPGEINVECSWPHWGDDYGNGWGNWGVISNYGGVRDTDQFAGHKFVDYKKQWQSCTRRNPKPSCWYYNDNRCTGQKADPDNARQYAYYAYRSDGSCEDIGVFTINGVFMHVYELDEPDADDPVASLLYGDVHIPLSCGRYSRCTGDSAWIAATSGRGTISARVQIRVRTNQWTPPNGH